MIWFQNLPVFARFITLDKIQIFFKSHFPHLCIWDNACSFFKWLLWGLSDMLTLILTLKIFRTWFDLFDIHFMFPLSEAKST